SPQSVAVRLIRCWRHSHLGISAVPPFPARSACKNRGNAMELKLKGRRALVTGSSSGIGESIARMLAQEGCAVVVHGRNRERAEKVAADINAVGVAIGELSTDEGAAAVHAHARAALGGSVEILINNAGGSSTGSGSR